MGAKFKESNKQLVVGINRIYDRDSKVSVNNLDVVFNLPHNDNMLHEPTRIILNDWSLGLIYKKVNQDDYIAVVGVEQIER